MAIFVLWSFILGLVPLGLGLGWRLVTSVGEFLWHIYLQTLKQARRRRPVCPQASGSYRFPH